MLDLLRIPRPETGYGRLLAYASILLAFGACFVLALMMYVIFADVILRYVFTAPIAGSVEIIYCLMGLLVCMGFGLTTLENGHVRVDILTSHLSRRARAVLDVVAHVLSVIAASLVCWRLAVYAIDQTRDLNETQVLALPVWLVALVMAGCSTLLVLALALHLARAVLAVVRPSAAP